LYDRITYRNEKYGESSHNGGHKYNRYDHRRARVANLEDVVNLGSGSISHGRLVVRTRSVWYMIDLNIENGRDERVG
jgi:hypothetical protein